MAATRVCIQAQNLATVSRSAKALTLSSSADIQLSNYVKNSFFTKCGEWAVYAEPGGANFLGGALAVLYGNVIEYVTRSA